CADIDGAAADATAARIRAAGDRAASLGLDVRDRAAVDEAVAMAVHEFGRLDILLDCAGISHRGNFLELDPAVWDRIIAVNLTGLTRASYTDPEARRATEALIPLGRLGQPDDLVGAVLFLAADESRWVTGSTVTVDGGYLAI